MSRRGKKGPDLMARVWLIPLILFAASMMLPLFMHEGIVVRRLEFILSSMITCAATFSGFTLTVVSILAGFTSSPMMQYLASRGGLRELSLRYVLSLLLAVALILVCIALGAYADEQNIVGPRALALCIGLALAYFWSFITSGWYLLLTVRRVSEHRDEQPGAAKTPPGRNRVD